MEGSDLGVGRLIGERYEVLRLLSDVAGQPRWLVRDRVSQKRRELRPAPEALTTQEALDARAGLGPYIISVLAVESVALNPEEPELMSPVLILEHHPHAITMATLAGTWKSVLLDVVGRIAQGLDALHQQGRVVGVLTPTSVQVVSASGGFMPVIDDLTAWAPEADDLVGAWVTGDAAFAAPEVLYDEEASSPAADVFSLGVLTAHAWSGCMPFRDEGGSSLFGRGPSVLARRPRELGPTTLDLHRLEPGLAEIIERCLALEPAQRPSAAELFEALHAHKEATAPKPQAHAPDPAEPQEREEAARVAAPIAEFKMDLEAITRSGNRDSDAEPASLAVQTPEPGATVTDGIGQGVLLRAIALTALAVALAVGGWLALSPGDTQGRESSAT